MMQKYRLESGDLAEKSYKLDTIKYIFVERKKCILIYRSPEKILF